MKSPILLLLNLWLLLGLHESYILGQECDSIFLYSGENIPTKIKIRDIKLMQRASYCFFDDSNKVEGLKMANLASYHLVDQKKYEEANSYLDSLKDFFKNCNSFKETQLLIRIYSRKGFINEKLKNYTTAYLHYQKVLRLANSLCNNSNYWECFDPIFLGSYVLSNLGNIYRQTGDFHGIISEIPEKFIDKFKEVSKGNNNVELAALLTNRGIAFLHLEKYEDALRLFQEIERLEGLDEEMKVMLQINFSLLHRKWGKSNWETYSLESLDLAERIISNVKDDEDFVLTTLAKLNWYRSVIYRETGKFENAIDEIQGSINILNQKYIDPYNSIYAIPYLLFSKLFEEKGQHATAIEYYHKVLKIYCPSLKESEIDDLPLSINIVPERNLVDALVGKANLWLSKANESELDKDLNLRKALGAHKLAVLVEDLIKGVYSQEDSRYRISKERNERNEQIMEIIFELWDEPSSESIVEDALFFMEKNRAQELQLALSQYEINLTLDRRTQGLNTSFRVAQYSTTKAKRKLIEAQTHPETDPLELRFLMRQLEDQEAQEKLAWVKFQEALNTNYSEHHVNQSYSDIPAVPFIQKYLAPKETFISFFNSSKFLYVLYLSKDHKRFERIPLEENFKSYLNTFKELLRTELLSPSQKLRYQKVAFEIYKKVLGPIENWGSKRLIVANCPILYDTPLEALLTQSYNSGENLSYSTWAYLWKRYEVCYTFSATLYFEKKNQPKEGQLDYLGFAPDYGKDYYIVQKRSIGGIVKELTFNSEEVWKSDSLYRIGGAHRKAFYSYDATIENFRNLAGSAHVLHLAMHAFRQDSLDLYPYLLFCPDSGATEDQVNLEENRLYISEIPTLDFSSELLILSACNSGLGKVVTGEGVMNFGRVFRMAGIPNTIMSLWEVDDYAPSAIIPNFIKYLQKGLTKTQALNEARETYLNIQNEGSSDKSPYHWAHFVLIGNPDPFYKKPSITSFELINQHLQNFYLQNPSLFWGALIIVLLFLLNIIYLSFRQLLN